MSNRNGGRAEVRIAPRNRFLRWLWRLCGEPLPPEIENELRYWNNPDNAEAIRELHFQLHLGCADCGAKLGVTKPDGTIALSPKSGFDVRPTATGYDLLCTKCGRGDNQAGD